MSLLSIWEKAQPAIKEKIGAAPYTTWFSSIEPKEKNLETLIIETPDDFFKGWIVEHYLETIVEKLQEASPDKNIQIEFAVNANVLKHSFSAPPIKQQEGAAKDGKGSANLNPRFSFDAFVVGPSNRFSYAACMAVAESPAKAYNPLFVYGHVGLGKTHLLQAIARQLKENHPHLNCCYTSSEKFTNELIEAIRHRSTPQFRQKYRNIDVLLIDDIHFIAGKESTQEEFFHTFNALHNSRKQIIISSDRPPKEIARLEDRLSSRFAWGLITDIQPPDYETRVAILRKKTEKDPINVPDDILSFIAEQVKTNIRELEGALIRVVASSILEEKPGVLKDMVTEKAKALSIELIQGTIAEFFNVSVSDLKAKKRNKNIIFPRQVAMYLSRKLTSFSLPEIGSSFGGKDHTTVLHSCKKIENEIKTNPTTKNTIDKIITALQR
jgi:chromosomal replication initiator protein